MVCGTCLLNGRNLEGEVEVIKKENCGNPRVIYETERAVDEFSRFCLSGFSLNFIVAFLCFCFVGGF